MSRVSLFRPNLTALGGVVAHAIDVAEGCVAAFWALFVQSFLLILVFGCVVQLGVDVSIPLGLVAAVALGFLVWCSWSFTLSLWLRRRAPATLVGRHTPAALRASEVVRAWPRWRRLLSLPWWLLLFASGLMFAIVAAHLDKSDSGRSDPVLLSAMWVFFFCAASNALFLAALASLGVGLEARRQAWRLRFLIDAGVAVAAAAGVLSVR